MQLLVKVENINCIAVDWEDGAKCTYFTAASNIRVLGAVTAYLINTLAVSMMLRFRARYHILPNQPFKKNIFYVFLYRYRK